jgi:hypothetical protein|tara:strand:+ start:851 stop:1084 length:234 start_codon:yes stop_codon:yes gene_type:complete
MEDVVIYNNNGSNCNNTYSFRVLKQTEFWKRFNNETSENHIDEDELRLLLAECVDDGLIKINRRPVTVILAHTIVGS